MSGILGFGLGEALLATLDQAPLILGSVMFEGHEVPSRISIGGAHAVAIHRLPGGGRIIDAMGVDAGAISWSGFFTGPSAAARARLVDMMRQSGQLAGLSFGDYAFNVIVVHFEYDLQDRGALISYRIRTEIVPDNTLQADDTAPAVAAAFADDIASAATALSGFALAGAQGSIAGVQAAFAVSGDPTSMVKLAALSVALRTSAAAVQAGILTSGGTLITGAGSSAAPITNSADLASVTASAGTLAGSVQSAGYVNRSNLWLDQLAGQTQGAPLISA